MQIVGDVNDESMPLLHHDPCGMHAGEPRGVDGGDGVAPDPGAQLPRRLGPFRHGIRAPRGIDHQIEMALLLLHAAEQAGGLLFVAQVGAHRDALSAARADFLGGIFHRSRRAIRGFGSIARSPRRDIHRSPGIAQRQRDASACAAAGSSYNCNLSL
jgi:hypothetical protein